MSDQRTAITITLRRYNAMLDQVYRLRLAVEARDEVIAELRRELGDQAGYVAALRYLAGDDVGASN